MNSTNINVQAIKSQQTATAVSRLTALDSQMSACGYSVDHPWRLTLADVIAGELDTEHLEAGATEIDPVRRQAYEIESRIGNIAVLLEAIFDKIDGLICVSPEQHNAINTFANSAMESAKAIRAANEEILSLAGGAQ